MKTRKHSCLLRISVKRTCERTQSSYFEMTIATRSRQLFSRESTKRQHNSSAGILPEDSLCVRSDPPKLEQISRKTTMPRRIIMHPALFRTRAHSTRRGGGVRQQRPAGGRTWVGGRGRRRGPKGLTRALKIENSKWPIFPADGTETKSRPAFIMTCIAVRAAVICTVSLQNAWVSAMRRGRAKA